MSRCKSQATVSPVWSSSKFERVQDRLADGSRMQTSRAVQVALVLSSFAASASAHEIIQIVGLDGKAAQVSHASADGALLIGTSSSAIPFQNVVTTWAAPDWKPRAVPTPTSLNPISIVAASADGQVIAGFTSSMDVYIWWDGLDHLPTIYDGDGTLFALYTLSTSGNAAVGISDYYNEFGLRSTVFTRDGTTFFAKTNGLVEPFVSCVSPNAFSYAGGVVVGTSDADGNSIYTCTLTAFIGGSAEALPLPEGFQFASLLSINDTGDRVLGVVNNRAADGVTLTPNVFAEWTRQSSGQWSTVVMPSYFDERWGKLRADGRRSLGYASGSEGPTLRDVFHGDRPFREVIERLFPELETTWLLPVTGALGEGRVVIGGGGSWIITLPALADLNENGELDGVDVGMFVDALGAGSPHADWNMDGELTFEDFDGFIADFESGTR